MQGRDPRVSRNGMSKTDLSSLKRLFTPNIGTIVFGILFMYIILTVIVYFTTGHIKTYQVTSGPLARNQTYTGAAVYDEMIVNAESSGFVEYYASGGSKVRKGGIVYGIGSSERQRTVEAPDAETLENIRQGLESFLKVYDPDSFHNVYSLKYQMEGELLKGSLDRASVVTGTVNVGNEIINTSPYDGIVSYTTDGFEGLTLANVSSSLFDETNYRVRSLKKNGRVEAGEPVYRLITSESWSLLIPLTPKQIVRLTDVDRIKVRFIRDGITETADFAVIQTSDGVYIGRLTFNSGLIRYIDSRFIDIELVTNTQVGLKIPVTAITTKKFFTIPEEYASADDEDGETGFIKLTTDKVGNVTTEFIRTTLYEKTNGRYYIDNTHFKEGDIIVKSGSTTDRFIVRDTGELEGVYSVNKGYAVFRKVIILDKNEDFCIVEKGTPYGIAQFDNIAERAASVRESQITAR